MDGITADAVIDVWSVSPKTALLTSTSPRIRAGEERAAGRLEPPHLWDLLGSEDLDALDHRQAFRKALETGHESGSTREAVRQAGERRSGDEIRPAGGVQAEGVPALRPPAPSDPPA